MSAIATTAIQSRRPKSAVQAGAPLSNIAFGAVIGFVGVIGLLLSLLINVATTQGAFEEARLTREVKSIEAAQQAAQQTLAMLASPGNLEIRARAMGMVPAASPVFLRLTDSTVLGQPEAARAEASPSAVTQLVPTSQALGPELQMAPAAVKAKVMTPRSDAAAELVVGEQ